MDLIRTTLQPDIEHVKKKRHLVGELQSFRSQSQARSTKIPTDLKIRIDNIIERQEKLDKLRSNRKLSNGSPSRSQLSSRMRSELQDERRKQNQLNETINYINEFETRQINQKRNTMQSVYQANHKTTQPFRTMLVFEKRDVMPDDKNR